jgi:non-ribosomal peptide synthetase-like protein
VIADGLSFMNAEFSSNSFRVMPVAIGTRNFLGNGIAYPAGGRTGDNCLLATKVLVPIAGPVREGVGLLGSPCFEIPRTVQRDHQFDHLGSGPELKRRLAAKNRHNGATMGLYLLVRYLYLAGVTLVAFWTFGSGNWPGWAAAAASAVFGLGFTVAYFVLVERTVTGFRALKPRYCSIYQAPFWRHERYWKVNSNPYQHIFDGTPFKGVLWRLLGVRIGRRVFDDGCAIVERTLVSVGDDCTLGTGSIVQSHSHRRRLHHRHQRLPPLRDHHGRRLGPRHRFLPYERRARSAGHPVGRQPRHRGYGRRPRRPALQRQDGCCASRRVTVSPKSPEQRVGHRDRGRASDRASLQAT